MAGRKLIVEIIGDTKGLNKGFKEAESSTQKFSSTLRGAALSTVKAFAPLVATFAAADFAKGAIDGAEGLRKAQDSLAVAIEKTGGDVQALVPQYTATAEAASQFGISQTEATTELARATLLTGDAAKAQAAYQEAVVISAATGKDLNAVLIAAAKAQDGHTSALARYGVLIDKTAGTQEQLNAVMKNFAGQAEANTTASDQLRANFENLQTNIGTVLLPAFEKIVAGLNNVVEFVMAHGPEISATMKKVMEDVRQVVKTVTEDAQAFWRTFGGVITAVMDQIVTVVRVNFKIVQDVFQVIGDLIHGDWSKLWHDIGALVKDTFNGIVDVLRSEIGIITQIMSLLGNAILQALQGFASSVGAAARAIGQAILDGIVGGLSGLGSALKSAIEMPINAVIDAWNRIGFDISIPSVHIPHGPTIGGGDISFHVPQLPHLAGGGVIAQSGIAVVHKGETVVPAGSGLGNTYHFSFPNYVGSKQELAQTVVAELRRANRAGQIPDFNFT